LATILAVDLLIVGRRPHEPTLRESALWVTGYFGLAVAFGLSLAVGYGPEAGGKFFAGWLTEYSLSIDNLFIFMIIMGQFAVPRQFQQKALMTGIVLALVMRGLFIGLGAAALKHFDWLFYLFGIFLVYTAYGLMQPKHETGNFTENRTIRLAQAILPVATEYDGARLTTRTNGRLQVTPMLLVMVALGTTDLVFALDSIPAIFGLTKAAYMVFTANVFALLGLRQLYFLIGGLLTRLVYLSQGLAAVLGFIGVKLILEALRDNELPFINGGKHLDRVPDIPIWLSLIVITGILTVAAIASLVKSGREPGREQSSEPVRYRAPDGKPALSGVSRRAERAGSGRAAHDRRPFG
jgi:integral membrane protein, TerC family